jgi:hypothetical protein
MNNFRSSGLENTQLTGLSNEQFSLRPGGKIQNELLSPELLRHQKRHSMSWLAHASAGQRFLRSLKFGQRGHAFPQ